MNLKSDFLSLLGLSAFTIAHPVLDSLGHGSTFFVTHGAQALDILTFTAVVYLLPALTMIALAGCLLLISSTLATVFIGIAVGVMAGLWVMSSVSALPAIYAIAIAIVLGGALGLGYTRFSRLRELLHFFGLLSPAVVVVFLAFTPIKGLLLPDADIEGKPNTGIATPIVFLLFDELSLAAITTPDGEIDAARLPNFSRLAALSTWYRDTTTVSTQTDKAVPAILSGLRPGTDSQPIYSEFPRNLFTLLAASHAVSAMETFTRLCPRKLCSSAGANPSVKFDARLMYRDVGIVWLHAILPTGLKEQYLPSIANSWSDFGQSSDGPGQSSANITNARMLDMGKDQRRRFKQLIDSVRNGSGPQLDYLHLALPHVPWVFLPDGSVYNGQHILGGSKLIYGWTDDQYLVDKGVLRYALQVEYTDSLLGELLDVLEASGRLVETLLVVVADHGVAFAPDEARRTPVPITLAGVARVPLFIKYPGQAVGVVDDRKIETIDILPTIADVLGVPLGETTDGQSLVSAGWKPRERHILETGNISDMESDMDLAEAQDRIYRVLTPGASALDAIGLGSGRAYMKKPGPVVDGFETGFVMRLDNARLFEAVDPAAGFLPARLTGMMSGAAAGTEVLITLNGSGAGSGQTYDEYGHVSIMLDPRQFRPGKNSLRAYRVGGPEVVEIEIVSDHGGWTIQRNERGVFSLVDPEGTSYLPDETLKGHVALSSLGLDLAAMTGYACDEQLQQAPLALLLVDGSEVVTSAFRQTGKPLLAKEEAVPDTLECWFALDGYEDMRQRRSFLSVLALFEGGRMLEIRLQKRPGDTAKDEPQRSK